MLGDVPYTAGVDC